VQWDCLTDEPLHIDFQRIAMDKPLKLEVRITTLGHPKGIAQGGRMIQDAKVLNLSCMPESVPDFVEIKIADMDTGDKILAKDLELPEGVTLDMPEDKVIMRLTDPDA
jgi:large subunit ribosomal protein L25